MRAAIHAPHCSWGWLGRVETRRNGGWFKRPRRRVPNCCLSVRTVDIGLTAVARTCHLPNRAPLVLFALGRTLGWIEHAIEQYSAGDLIRPRARCTGLIPGEFQRLPVLFDLGGEAWGVSAVAGVAVTRLRGCGVVQGRL
jgi:hypothetical protein